MFISLPSAPLLPNPLLGAGVLSVDAVLSMFTNVFVHGYNTKLIEISMIILLSAILQIFGRALH
jgi:hypothetical protein